MPGQSPSPAGRGAPTRWGFHRLREPWPARLVAASGVGPADLVLDVGAGDGALTAALVATGARVIAVELHPARVAALRRRFQGADVVVVHADAADLRLPRRPFVVVANPPFAVAGPVLRRLMAPGSRLVGADLVLPRPVARQWAAGVAPGAARWRSVFRAEVHSPLPRRAFAPPATTDVAVLRLRRRGGQPRNVRPR